MTPGVLVALDLPEVGDAVALARSIVDEVAGFKVGLELLMGPGADAVERVADLGKPVFADAKLHDIPATAERAARQLGARGARWVTAHVSGGSEMLRAAACGLSEGSGGSAGVLGVTVLTSLDDAALSDTGVGDGVESHVSRLVGLAAEHGAEGVICSLREVSIVKDSGDLLAVTPGIRMEGEGSDDQRRVSTVGEARDSDVDYLVIGRSITGSSNPRSAVARINSILTGSG